MTPLPTKRGAWAAAVGWMAACLAVLGGLPAWLVRTWGWPPPTLGLGIHAGGFPAHPGPGAGVGIVDVAVWVAWAGVAWFAAAVVIEIAQAAGESVPRRLVGLGPAQALAARAVGAILLVRALSGAPAAPTPGPAAALVLDHHARLAPSDPEVVATEPAAAVEAGPAECTTAPVPDPDTAALADGQGPAYVVERGDTLWGIAAAQLGDPLRWPEIAAANYGRPQPDGRALTSAHWIFPGWVLRLPAPGGAPPPPGSLGADPGTTPSAAAPPVAAAETRPIPATAPRRAAGPGPGSALSQAARQGSVPERHGGRHPADQIPAPVEAGLAAAGIVAAIEALRRVQQRHRRPGRRIRLPEAPAAAGEARLRALADPEMVQRVDEALRGLAAALARAGGAAPTPTLLSVGEDACELVVGPSAGEPPPGSGSWPGSWLIGASPGDSNDDAAHPWPALATLGADGPNLVLVNLEAAATLALAGEPGVVVAVLRAMAAELATAPWAAGSDLVLVGFGEELRRLPRPRLAGSLEEVAAEVAARREEADRLLAGSGHPNLAAARLAAGGDAWAPLVVLSGVAPSEEELAALTGAAVPGGPVVIVAPGMPGANWCLDLTGPEAVLDPLGLRLQPSRLDDESWAGLAGALAVAADTDDVPATPETEVSTAAASSLPGSTGATQPGAAEIDLRDGDRGAPVVQPEEVVVPPAPEVEVQVLGPVRLVGNAVEPERPKYTEVVTRLAMAERPLTTDELVTDVWAGAAARATVDSAVSKAREILGTRPDGTPRLARAQGYGERALHESVRTDWWRFRFLAAQGSTPALRMALELVRGRPFEGFRADWADRIYVPEIESAIIDVAEQLARRALEAADLATARWAARRGLAAANYDERLWRLLMQSVHDEGGMAAMEAVFDECARVVEATVEPFDSLQPETVELYLRLGGRRRNSAAASVLS